MTGVNPPGADDPDLEPPPATEEEENERRERIKLPQIVEWYQRRGLPLDVELTVWRVEVEGASFDADDR